MNSLQLQFLILIFAGWLNRSQQGVIEYLQEENRVLREQMGGKSDTRSQHQVLDVLLSLVSPVGACRCYDRRARSILKSSTASD